MKKKSWTNSAHAGLLAAALIAAGACSAWAAAPALNGQLQMRPLTPQEIKDYSLTGAQGASGLNTVGIGQPAYLDAVVNIAIARSNIVGVTWTLTNRPMNSAAVLTANRLGTNLPVYKPADRTVLQVAGRATLVPDVTGPYTVIATVTTVGSGTTNILQKITAGTYMGVQTCALCHSGGVVASNTVTPWSQTAHASAFRLAIDGLDTDHFSKNCISCHAVGYDQNTNAINGGFDDIAKQLNWTFPPTLTNGNWDAMPAALKAVSNVQCENCHGPGSEHAFSLGDTTRISRSVVSGDCAQCHDSLTHHFKTAEWNNSAHASTTRTPSGPTRLACVRCHTAEGFIGYVDHMGNPAPYATNTVYEAITCATCHDPHDASKPHQLRTGENFTLGDGTVVTNAGSGGFCFNCHSSRNGSVTNSIVKYPLLQQTWNGGSSFGVHDSSQADLLEGVNAVTYGKVIPSAAHRSAITNTCVACHMQEMASTDPGFTKAGGHTFKMNYSVINGGITNTVDKVEVCVKCHGEMESFDMLRSDYNGDGVIEGVQTEVQHLLDSVSKLLPNSTYRADGNYVADGLVKSPSVKTNWQTKFLKGAYNWQFVNADGSKGIHNAPFAVGILKASIADLTGDSNTDGLPDSWQITYFGSATNPNAAPNAAPAGDGVPNWVKYSLGLNPMTPGVVVPDGVVWMNGNNMVGSENPADTVKIYTAAEIVFDTVVGTSYQIQGVSSLSSSWQNIGTWIPGTGGSISYVTPTRSGAQMFFRVIHNP